MDWEDKKAVEAAIPKRDAKKGFGQYQTPPHLYRSLLKPEDRYMAVSRWRGMTQRAQKEYLRKMREDKEAEAARKKHEREEKARCKAAEAERKRHEREQRASERENLPPRQVRMIAFTIPNSIINTTCTHNVFMHLYILFTGHKQPSSQCCGACQQLGL